MRRCTGPGLLLSLLAPSLLCIALPAQTKPSSPDAPTVTSFGTVTGHVYFAGSNAPARLVNIALQPIQVKLEDAFQPGKRPALGFTIYQTGLDGSYTIPHVAPGTYYVVVNEPGFLSPFTQFTPQEMAHPTPDLAQKMAATLPAVAVRPNATSTLDVMLQRGAGISGALRFDDGTPYVGGRIFVQRRNAEGKWVSTSGYSDRAVADADGRWEVSGLLPGEYRLRVVLSVNDRKQSSLLGNSSSSTSYDMYTLSFYSGDTARERDAKSFKLEENQQLDGEDLTIPVSKLHAITGAVVDANTGQPLNSGALELDYSDGGDEAASTSIDPESRTFTFNFVPEGQYKLRAKNAREVQFEAPPPDEDDPNFPNRFRRPITLRQYAPGEISLTVQGDTSAVNLPVELKSTTPQ